MVVLTVPFEELNLSLALERRLEILERPESPACDPSEGPFCANITQTRLPTLRMTTLAPVMFVVRVLVPVCSDIREIGPME